MILLWTNWKLLIRADFTTQQIPAGTLKVWNSVSCHILVLSEALHIHWQQFTPYENVNEPLDEGLLLRFLTISCSWGDLTPYTKNAT